MKVGIRKPMHRVLLTKILLGDDCWEWTAARDRRGYGVVRNAGKACRAHRIVYEYFVGPIPEGLVLDHLCVNPCCVRPDHLEPVTQAENARRVAVRGTARTATHCKSGHAYTSENIYWRSTGGRACRACGREATKRYLARKKVAA